MSVRVAGKGVKAACFEIDTRLFVGVANKGLTERDAVLRGRRGWSAELHGEDYQMDMVIVKGIMQVADLAGDGSTE